MQFSGKSWALSLVSAAALISIGAHAQTAPAPAPTNTTPVTTPPTLAPAPKPTTPTPGKDFSTDLAKASLTKQGITHPTPAQLADAKKSIQVQRASGMGWGQIAHSLGLNFGKVVSAANRARHDEDAKHADARKHTEGKRHAAEGKHGHDSQHATASMAGHSIAGASHAEKGTAGGESHGSANGGHGGNGGGGGGGHGK